MDVLGSLIVRFHFNGRFTNDGKKVQYCGGQEAMSYIDRDKVSLPEIVGHLRDHYIISEGQLLHWLFPGKQLDNGLLVLVDDTACLKMSNTIVEGGVADIYVEDQQQEEVPEDDCLGCGDSNFEDELEEEFEDESSEADEDMLDDEIQEVVITGDTMEDIQMQMKGKEMMVQEGKEGTERKSRRRKRVYVDEGSSTDNDYMPGDSCSSEDDEEAAEIRKKFKEFKKKWKKGDCASLDDVFLEGSTALPAGFALDEEEGYGTPYAGSSQDEATEDEMLSEGELVRNTDGLPRYKKTNGTPVFSLSMKFRSKHQFKKAIIKYGLAERKLIKFIKDEPKRVRAKCEWKHCPWVCLLSTNSRTPSWQIVTFNDYHTCPPRRDNRLVTARRIAEKYEKFIMANPTWNYASMKQIVQEEMFADVNIAKLKRAKALVMQKVYDSTKGQYQRLYDYQLELLRSNPGSTIVVAKEPDVEPPTFQRMYICLDALKKGFLAGCRKVVGLDGCFFKGAINGELLCAIGRDANNQMYPIAWAVVEKETKDSWEWFCQLLFKDLGVGDGSDWVFISDQQKGILYAVEKWAPAAEHRNCARYIYANWKKHFNDKEWQKKWWACAKAPCVMLFNKARARLAKVTASICIT
ncbi:unnamed protein product [Urochloa humidicola]